MNAQCTHDISWFSCNFTAQTFKWMCNEREGRAVCVDEIGFRKNEKYV